MFYYREGYEMEASEALKNLILARDKYLESFFALHELEPESCDLEEEVEKIKVMMETVREGIFEKYKEEKLTTRSE